MCRGCLSLLHRWTPGCSNETCWQVCTRNSPETIWLFFCMSSTREMFFIGIFMIILMEVFLDSIVVTAPVLVFFITFEGKLYVVGIINCSIGCSHSRTRYFPVNHKSTCGFHQLPHCSLNNWITQGVPRVRGRQSSWSCRNFHFGRLA